jgi:A/G-specific adenine glycosylase
MLQQTQVATVLGYYPRFLQRFPEVAALAAAPLDEVLHLWSGLGYYSRARNLHRAAQCIIAEHGGELPEAPEALAALPGIGRSTAAAIAAIAYGRRAAILDGNVRRVLSRYFGIEGPRGARATELELWQRAEACTPEAHVGTYTQAIMDLGATLCTRRQPLCERCPLSEGCLACRTGRTHELPATRARAARPQRSVVMLIAERADGSVLLRRRAARGVWGALWTPPEFGSAAEAEQFCARELPGARLDALPLPTLQHAFTHFDLEILPLRARCGEARVEGAEVLWYNAREPALIGLPAPIATLLSSLETP